MRLHSLTIILILSFLLLLAVQPAHAWYSGYNYEQTVTVGSSPDGALSNYQIIVNVYSGTGTNSVNTAFLQGHALNFPNDIRFTDNNDNDYYYYLIYSNATYAQFRVRVTSIPDSGNQLMRIYYGQTSGTSASSAAYTYDIYNAGPQNINSLHGGWFTVGTVGTASRNCWYTVPIYYYSSGSSEVKIGVGTTNTFWFGTWGGTPENMPTSVTGGTFTMVFTDGNTTNNVYLYDQYNALVSGYPKSFDFGTGHVLKVSVGAGASTTVNGWFGGSNGAETAVAYTTNIPGMGLWSGEASAAQPTITLTTNATSGTVPLDILFNATSPNGVESWSWNFGDGWTSTAQNITHTYSSAGNYTVALTGTNAYSSKTVYTTISAHEAPNASFTYLAGSVVGGTQTYYFYDTSTGDPATSWAWNFGDNSTNSTLQNPTHTYTAAEQYKVIMTATNAYGSSSASVNLSVKIDTSITGTIIVINNNIPCGAGLTVKLIDQSGVTMVSSTTSSSGSVEITSITPGTTYTLQISGTGIPNYTGKISFSTQNTKFWVDVGTNIITPDSQKVLTTHTTQLHITHWLGTASEAYMSVVLQLNGVNASATTQTDYNGYVSFMTQSNVMYTVWIYNTTQGVNVTRYMDLSGTSYNIDISGSGSWFYNSGAGSSSADSGNGAGSTGHPDQDIVTDATGFLNGASSTITCNYTDISQSTLTVNIDIYKPNNTGPMLPMDKLQTYNHVPYVGNVTETYTITDSDPAGKSYIVYINSTYSLANGGTGHLYRTYTVSFPGPMRLIPGCPATWYKYLAFIILITIGLVAGKFGVETASIAICAFASIFFAMQWFYEINAWYMGFVIGAAWVMSIAAIWFKAEREGKI